MSAAPGARAWTPGPGAKPHLPPPFQVLSLYPAAVPGPGAPNTTPRTHRSSGPSVGKGFSVSQPMSLSFF